MKSSIAIAAVFAMAQAQSSGWQINQNQPSKAQLTQENYRCGCPMPKPAISGCQAAIQSPPTTGCGCQPAECNPKPENRNTAPTKVLALQCHDVTTWKTETVDVPERKIRQKKIKKQRPVMRTKTTYEDQKAIRYRMEIVEEDQMKWEVKQVQKTEYKTVTSQVRVVAPPATRIDCCGRNVPLPTNPCSCAAPPKYTMRTITKQVPVTRMVSQRVQVPCKVKVKKNVPYEVTVKKPVTTQYQATEDYWETKDEDYIVNMKQTKSIPIVTRQCTDAAGRMIKTIEEVPLHHSGPAPTTRSEFNTENAGMAANVVQQSNQFMNQVASNQVMNVNSVPSSGCGGPGQAGCSASSSGCGGPGQAGCSASSGGCGGPGQAGCPPLSDFSRASLVDAPLDRNLGNGMGLVQVGVVDPRLHGSWGAANGRPKMMQGQWQGQFLAEKDAEVTEDDSSDAEE